MRVAIRTDASLQIGTGHAMRCLCLADALREQGASVRFLSRTLPGHLLSLIVERGHDVTSLPAWSGPWTEDSELRDAKETREALAGHVALDGLIVDHYELSAPWERAMAGVAARRMVIDDIGRKHDCEVLLDQNFYLDATTRYRGRVPKDCAALVGPAYALLRPEFLRARAQARIRDGAVQRLLVFLGGMDADNVTEQAISALQHAGLSQLAVDVVVGPMHPARERIEHICAALPRGQCHVQPPNWVELLLRADLAIGAGGTATWERCALGLPALTLCLAENQRQVLHDGARQGFLYAPDEPSIAAEMLATHLRALVTNSGLRSHLSRTGFDLVDGKGAQRVAAAFLQPSVGVRRATRDDCESVHGWRNHPEIRAVSRDTREVGLEDHRRWFESVLASAQRHLLIGERQSAQPVGVVRFDQSDSQAEVSIYLVPSRFGQGEGQALLRAAENWLRAEHPEVTTVIADVLGANVASRKLFERSGYELQSTRYGKKLHS